MHRTVLLAILASAALGLCAEDRYWVMFRDGSTATADQIADWHDTRKTPAIAGRPLFDERNPAVLIQETTLRPDLEGPFIEFANGDVLPGSLVGFRAAQPSRGLPGRLVVSLREPLSRPEKHEPAELEARADRVKRVVLIPSLARAEAQPGILVTRDGRCVRIQAARWGEAGLKALSDEGVFQCLFTDLAQVDLPGVPATEAVLEDASLPCPAPQSLVGRLVTRQGAELTFRVAMDNRSSRSAEGRRYPLHMIQPAWALESICVPGEAVCHYSFRAPNEAPLSLLPAVALSQKSFTGFLWPWRRNRNLRGGLMQSGSVFSVLGFSAHSYSEIAFELPAGARSLTAWAGLDQAVGGGGCAVCRVHKEQAAGAPLYAGDFLRGGREPVRIGPLDLAGARRVVMVTEFGDEGRPADSDPLDIRDEVDWLMPLVSLPTPQLAPEPANLARLLPALEGWQLDQASLAGAHFSARFYRDRGRWEYVWRPAATAISLRRTSRAPACPLLVELALARADKQLRYAPELSVNGTPVKDPLYQMRFSSDAQDGGRTVMERWVVKAEFGQELNLNLVLRRDPALKEDPAGLAFRGLCAEPLIQGLALDAPLPQPDVLLSLLKEAEFKPSRKSGAITRDRAPGNQPLEVAGQLYDKGLGLKEVDSIAYELRPEYRRFVAILCAREESLRSFRVLADEKVIGEVNPVERRRPVLVQAAIPQGARKLRLSADSGEGEWLLVNAGFVTANDTPPAPP